MRERVVELAASARRVIRAIGESDPPPGFANPTPDRLPATINDYAPNVANLHIPDDDRVARFADEMIRAAALCADADPRSIHGSTPERLRALFRAVGLAAHGLAV